MTYHISLPLSLLPGPGGEPQFGGDLEGLAAEVAEEDDHHAGHAQTPGVLFNRHLGVGFGVNFKEQISVLGNKKLRQISKL